MKKIYLLFLTIFTLGVAEMNAQCQADFQYWTNGLTANFMDSSFSSTGNLSYFWDFGTGAVSTQSNPSYTFSQSGSYTVCLTISDSLCTDSICKTVTVSGTPPPPQPCVASYTYSITPASGGRSTVFFNNTSTGYANTTTFYVNYGNGNSASFPATNGVLNFQQLYFPGTYVVTLSMVDSTTNCSSGYVDTVVVPGAQPCNLSYSYSMNANNTVNFTSSISGGTAPYTYSWDFGDNSAPATVANPSHTYANTGAYSVNVTATDANGTTCSYFDTVYVNFCNADFSYSVNSNGVATFTNQSTPLNSGVNYSWNFGDGNSSTMMNPTNTYTASNNYVVTLALYDSLTNCSSVYSDTVNVQIGTPNNCNASYTVAKDSSLAFGVILYNTSSNFGSHTYSWNFGDGTTGSGRTPIHQYQSFGSYVVCLTITDTVLNCTSTFCDTVGMDTLGNLKAGFGIRVLNPTVTGIPTNKETLNAISLYPNPANDQITLDLSSSSTPISYTIMDITGKTVRAEQRSMSMERVNLTGLEKGIYFMVLNNGATQVVKKFVKK